MERNNIFPAPALDRIPFFWYNLKLKIKFKINLPIKEGIKVPSRHYQTKQQDEILRVLKGFHSFVTVDALYDKLLTEQVKVGRATVYRFLERLTDEGQIVKCKAAESGSAEYRYLSDEQEDAAAVQTDGRLCCIVCGSVSPLHCVQLAGLSRHILNEHGFILDAGKTVLYGRCARCAKITAAPKGGSNRNA